MDEWSIGESGGGGVDWRDEWLHEWIDGMSCMNLTKRNLGSQSRSSETGQKSNW